MDQSLNAHVKLDVGLDIVRIDVIGTLNRETRPALLQLIQRIRRSGAGIASAVASSSSIDRIDAAGSDVRRDMGRLSLSFCC